MATMRGATLGRAGLFSNVKSITPSDTSPVPQGTVGLKVGGAGNLNLKGEDGTTAIIAVVAGEYVPFAGNGFVMSTSTTATSIVALRE